MAPIIGIIVGIIMLLITLSTYLNKNLKQNLVNKLFRFSNNKLFSEQTIQIALSFLFAASVLIILYSIQFFR